MLLIKRLWHSVFRSCCLFLQKAPLQRFEWVTNTPLYHLLIYNRATKTLFCKRQWLKLLRCYATTIDLKSKGIKLYDRATLVKLCQIQVTVIVGSTHCPCDRFDRFTKWDLLFICYKAWVSCCLLFIEATVDRCHSK